MIDLRHLLDKQLTLIGRRFQQHPIDHQQPFQILAQHGLITAALLQRPNTTVIATSRKPVNTTESPALASGSKFISFLLDEENPAITSATLAARLEKEQGITKLNVVIANAGDSAGFYDVAGTNPEDMMYDFRVNSVGPAKLFQACWPLLDHDGCVGALEEGGGDAGADSCG